MAKYRDDFFCNGVTKEDKGCPKLAALLGHPVRCLACPLDKCLYDMSDEEIKDVEERLRLLHIALHAWVPT